MYDESHFLRNIREKYNLYPTQVAAALGRSTALIENLVACNGLCDRFGSKEEIQFLIKKYVEQQTGPHRDTNHLFKRYPLSFARTVLVLGIEEISERYNMSPVYWSKCEGNSRLLSRERLAVIEEDVRIDILKHLA